MTHVRFARRRAEHERAYRLVYETYREQGYITDDEAWKRYRRLFRLPETHTIIAVQSSRAATLGSSARKRIVGTISLIAGSGEGLPMEGAFGEELAGLRSTGRRIAEAASLAVCDRRGTRSRSVFFGLTRFLIQYARYRRIDDLVVAVHPRHARFYARLLGFRPLGGQRSYTAVCGHPAVAHRLSLDNLGGSNPSLRALHFSRRIPTSHFEQPTVRLADRPGPRTPGQGDPCTVSWAGRQAS